MSTHWPAHYRSPEALFSSQGKDLGQQLTHPHEVGLLPPPSPEAEEKPALS